MSLPAGAHVCFFIYFFFEFNSNFNINIFNIDDLMVSELSLFNELIIVNSFEILRL